MQGRRNDIKMYRTGRGAGATGAAGATAPVAQTVWGQHGGNMFPFLPELHFEIRALFTVIGIHNYC
jgi:hypothetical protein